MPARAPYVQPIKPRAKMRPVVEARRAKFRAILARTAASRAELDERIRMGNVPISA